MNAFVKKFKLFTMVTIFGYICKKNTIMKKIGILLFASMAVMSTSCSSTEETEETVEVTPVTYQLDTENSKLSWKGDEGPEHFHTGDLKFSEGTLTMKGEDVESGEFIVDMKSISVTDQTPQEKVGYLVGHLQNEDFFNVEKFPTVKVVLGEYNDGKLKTTIHVLGQEITNDLPVRIKADGETASIEGDFEVDFASTNMPGIQPDPESGEAISSVFSFTLKAKLKK